MLSVEMLFGCRRCGKVLQMPFFEPTDETPSRNPTPSVVLSRLFATASAAGLVVYIGAYLSVLPTKQVEIAAFQKWPLWGIVTSLLAFLCGAFRQDGKRRQTLLAGAFLAFVWALTYILTALANGF